MIMLHKGGCHCGKVRFEFNAPDVLDVTECNCSICAKSGYLHVIVNSRDFSLLSGSDDIETYIFGTHTAKHLFCRTCGIKSFYVPRSHPDGYSINARCIDSDTVTAMKVKPFDGQHWEEHVDRLRSGHSPDQA